MRHSTLYTVLFATAICLVCGILVSGMAVSLADQQQANLSLDRRQRVLEAAGLATPSDQLTKEQVDKAFEGIETRLLDLQTGELDAGPPPEGYDYRKAATDPAASFTAPANGAGLGRLAQKVPAYFVKNEQGRVDRVVLPIEGLGLWGTLYGFLGIDSDGDTVRGITYYQQKETPGLGGEVDNPKWKGLWPGRKIYDHDSVKIAVIKGQAGKVADDPFHIDGLSGATITSRGVSNMLQFWLGPEGYEGFLKKLKGGELGPDLQPKTT